MWEDGEIQSGKSVYKKVGLKTGDRGKAVTNGLSAEKALKEVFLNLPWELVRRRNSQGGRALFTINASKRSNAKENTSTKAVGRKKRDRGRHRGVSQKSPYLLLTFGRLE